MEINTLLLSRIMEDQQKAWALLEEWYQKHAGAHEHNAILTDETCLPCKTNIYLTPIRTGLATIEANLAKAQEVKVVKGVPSLNLKTLKGIEPDEPTITFDKPIVLRITE